MVKELDRVSIQIEWGWRLGLGGLVGVWVWGMDTSAGGLGITYQVLG